MSQKFPDYEFSATSLSDAEFNARFSSLDGRLDALERGSGGAARLLVPGALTTGRKHIILLETAPATVKVSLSSPAYPAGQSVKVNLYKNGEPGGGAGGTALFVTLPELLTLAGGNVSGASAFVTADAGVTLAAGDRIAVDVEQADLGPLSNLLITILLEP